MYGLIHWFFPPTGRIKVNTDGSFHPQFTMGSIGDLTRDDQGRWIEGFCGRIGYADPLKVEMWAIHHALKLIQERMWNNAIVERDSQLIVQLLSVVTEENHPLSIMIKDCKALLELWKVELLHTLRERNRCADKLTKLGAAQPSEAIRMLVLPLEVIDDLKADMQSTSFVRGS